MSHRNKKLVFTNLDDTSLPTNPPPPTKRKDIDNDSEKPRRSARIAKRTKPNLPIKVKSDSESDSDSDTIETSNNVVDSDVSDDEMSISDEDSFIENDDDDNLNTSKKSNMPPQLRRSIGRAVRSIFDPSVGKEKEEYDDILEDFEEEPWFKNLTNSEKDHYVKKMIEIKKYKEQIPSLKDVMDMEISQENIKVLLFERMALDALDKLSIEYDDACRKFLKHVAYLNDTDTPEKQQQIQTIQNEITNQSIDAQPLKDRILGSEFDDKTKAVLYNKYLAMTVMSEDEAVKYTRWIETALTIPHHPKTINLEKNIPQNEAMSKLIREMMTKLNEKVYGMEVAKEEFLCMMVNMIVNPQSKHKAIGLYGPPGIGKTLLAEIVSNVLDIPMAKIALGGVTDSSFLEGHGFTYIGAEPGCILKGLIEMKCTNGIFYLDEVDKISKAVKGKEIEHSLLHITDFTQNHNFRDKYMPEIPADLSRCIFIYSMNTVKDLDSALASRIPVVRFDGYTFKEKIQIVENYMLPELFKNYAIPTGDVIIPRNVVEHLILNVKEVDVINQRSGVRGLKNVLNSILNRINLYRLASVDGKLNIKLSFEIPDFKIPYTMNITLVDTILETLDASASKDQYGHMFI